MSWQLPFGGEMGFALDDLQCISAWPALLREMGEDWSAASWYACPDVKMSFHTFKKTQSCLPKMWQSLQPSSFLSCCPRSSHCSPSIYTPVGSCPVYVINIWWWGLSFGNMFAEWCALRSSQGVTATIVLCFVNLGQPALVPWYNQRSSEKDRK